MLFIRMPHPHHASTPCLHLRTPLLTLCRCNAAIMPAAILPSTATAITKDCARPRMAWNWDSREQAERAAVEGCNAEARSKWGYASTAECGLVATGQTAADKCADAAAWAKASHVGYDTTDYGKYYAVGESIQVAACVGRMRVRASAASCPVLSLALTRGRPRSCTLIRSTSPPPDIPQPSPRTAWTPGTAQTTPRWREPSRASSRPAATSRRASQAAPPAAATSSTPAAWSALTPRRGTTASPRLRAARCGAIGTP